MKKLMLLTGVIFLAVFELHAQQQEKQKTPDQEIIINKKYDDQGNLVQYDSTTIHRWSFEERLNRQLFRFREEHYAFPELKNKEFRQEWEQLMEKHRLELEELRKKWEKKEQKKGSGN